MPDLRRPDPAGAVHLAHNELGAHQVHRRPDHPGKDATMSTKTDYEPYLVPCPRCGYPDSRDDGPYEPHWTDAALGGPPDPRVHLLWCAACGKPFDAGPGA